MCSISKKEPLHADLINFFSNSVPYFTDKESLYTDNIALSSNIDFLSHPLAGDIKANKNKVTALARQLALDNPDRVIFSPIHMLDFLDDEVPGHRQLGLRYCKTLLESGLFNRLLLAPGWTTSEGCIMEKGIAEIMGMKVVELGKGLTVMPYEDDGYPD